MSLEFIIEKECSFKKKYDNDLLFALDLMQKSCLVKKLPELISENTDHNEEEIRSSRIIQGTENKHQTLEEIEIYLAQNRHCDECSSCPANSSGLAYGCYNRIAYPISESFERKIIENLPAEDTFAFELLIQAMKDFPITAVKALKEFRRKGFTESKTAIQKVLKKKSLFVAQKISSDFFLHLLFFSGDLLQVSHVIVILLFFGIIPHCTTIDEFQDRKYIESKINDSLKNNNFLKYNESAFIHSMSISVLLNKPLALLM